jgi:GDP-L-fucose synthase
MVGSAIARSLTKRGDEVLKVDRETVDQRNQAAVQAWLRQNRPDAIVLAAAKVGGIYANDAFPADFIYDNLAIETNVTHAAHLAGIDRLLFLGSSCVYPKFAAQPIKEEALLTGPLEPTNEWYVIAKIAGIKLCQAYRKQRGRHYISVMPCNLYGPGDNFDLLTSHALPALIRKFHEAKKAELADVVVWGTGKPLREFLHVDDLANAVAFCLDHYDGYDHINCGAGSDIWIADLANSSGASSATAARSYWIQQGPTAHPASFWIRAGSPPSAGSLKFRSKSASPALTSGISGNRPTAPPWRWSGDFKAADQCLAEPILRMHRHAAARVST